MQSFDYASMAVLADHAAHRLATKAFTDTELREALHTTPSHNGVRIGKCEITYRIEDTDRIYDVRYGNRVIRGLAFYDTARVIVQTLNAGRSPNCAFISHLLRTNGEYRRARDRTRFHSARTEYYFGKGDRFRAHLNENKLTRDSVQAHILQHRLLHDPRNY